MTEFIRVAALTDLKSGSMKKIQIGGQELMLAKIGDRFYCTDAYCPHLGGDLTKGVLPGENRRGCRFYHTINHQVMYCGE